VTRFEGRDATALRRALLERRTRAHLAWSWTVGNVPRRFAVKVRSFIRFSQAAGPGRPLRGASLTRAAGRARLPASAAAGEAR
jgi:hypothetical protein